MRVSANFKMILASAATLAILTAGAPRSRKICKACRRSRDRGWIFRPGSQPTAARFTLRTAATIRSRRSTRPRESLRIVAGKLFQEGSNDGVGDTARFNSPDGMTINGAESLSLRHQ